MAELFDFSVDIKVMCSGQEVCNFKSLKVKIFHIYIKQINYLHFGSTDIEIYSVLCCFAGSSRLTFVRKHFSMFLHVKCNLY
jgi:hypothetical protein